MGRLMDDVLAMFGIKPSDRVSFPSRQPTQHPWGPPPMSTSLSENLRKDTDSETLQTPVEMDQKTTSTSRSSFFTEFQEQNPSFANQESKTSVVQEPSTAAQHDNQNAPETALRVSSTPVDTDCLSCKVIGTGICLIGGVMMGAMAWQYRHKQIAPWRKKIILVCGCILPVSEYSIVFI